MFYIKPLLGGIFLFGIFTNHHCSAQKTLSEIVCENLLEEFWSVETTEETLNHHSRNNGRINFKKAYTDLSLKTINNYFKIPVEVEDLRQKQKRELQYDLIKDYFLKLYINHDIDFGDRISIIQWCQVKVEEVTRKLNENVFNTLKFDRQIEICRNSIKRVFNIDYTIKPIDIFKVMYEDWTIEELTLIGRTENDFASTSQPSQLNYTKETEFNIEGTSNNFASSSQLNRDTEYYIDINIEMREAKINYPLYFFKYYREKTAIAQTSLRGYFRSIENYCAEYGQYIARRSGAIN